MEGRYSFDLEAVDRAGLIFEQSHAIVIDLQPPTSKVDTPPTSRAQPSEVRRFRKAKKGNASQKMAACIEGRVLN